MTAPVPARPGLPRRTVLKAGAVGAVGTAVLAGRPRPARAAGPVFRHGVASGDPLADAVLLWTRVTPDDTATPGSGRGPAVEVRWQVAADPAFRRVVRQGTVRTDSGRDHTVSVDATGLAPYTRYWYRFTALGQTSPVGRTQTTARDAGHALRLAFVSCANWTGGYFSAYGHVARRDDLDVVLHLGDYVYEYGNGADRYGPAGLVGKRDHQPAHETVSLADYRQRHAQYKTDPDLQAAHARHPWIVVFDDHEVCDNTYDGGGVNHQAAEGDFAARRARAYQAYLEWMPIRLPDQSVPHRGTRFWRRFSFGPLADLTMVETRQNRSAQVDGLAGSLLGVDAPAFDDPARVLMEPEQMAWLQDGLRSRIAQWHLVGNQTVFTRVVFGKDLPGRDQLSRLGIGGTTINTDQWDGYQDDQRQVLEAMAEAGGDPVVLTGDIHSAWANDVPLDAGSYVPAEPLNNSVAVEFVCPSVTSDGFSEALGGPEAADALTTGIKVTNPHVRYLDGISHGYCTLDVTPARVQCDFFFIDDRESPDARAVFATAWSSAKGSRSLMQEAAPVGAAVGPAAGARRLRPCRGRPGCRGAGGRAPDGPAAADDGWQRPGRGGHGAAGGRSAGGPPPARGAARAVAGARPGRPEKSSGKTSVRTREDPAVRPSCCVTGCTTRHRRTPPTRSPL